MGTPDFAAEILQAIIEDRRHKIAGVVTAVDKAAGRGMKIQESPVKIYARQQHLPVLQPEKLRDTTFIQSLYSLKADIFVVVAFRMLPEVVWRIPPKGTINLHASLLPQYRGSAPINWAIINGETHTGVTTFFINEKIDEGNILLTEKTDISTQDNAESLHNKLFAIGKITLLKTLKEIEEGVCKEQKQPFDCPNLKLAPKLSKENTLIDWHWTAERIYNFVRGLSPYPVAFSRYKNRNGEEMTLKIFSCRPETVMHNTPFGKMLTDNKTFLKIACSDGYIYINELQIFGKKRMNVHDFLLGNKWFDDAELY
jgi:methionyl-tRNA formyltransferase